MPNAKNARYALIVILKLCTMSFRTVGEQSSSGSHIKDIYHRVQNINYLPQATRIGTAALNRPRNSGSDTCITESIETRSQHRRFVARHAAG